jgi:prepilin-type N-terminal cleavage/methylation domain-containing protein
VRNRTAGKSAKNSIGFTLIELLVVMALIGVILAFTIPAIVGTSRAGNVSSAGRQLSNVLTVARSEAINRRALIRFTVATDWPDKNYAYRKFTILQHDVETGTDTQLMGWETLPTGTIFQSQDPDANANPAPGGKYFFDLNQTQNVKFAGKDIATAYIEFTATGGLNMNLADSPVRLRIDQGVYDTKNSAIILTGPNNWYEASIDGLIGRIRLLRP